MSVTEQLREQNNSESWSDCTARGLHHHWTSSHTTATGFYLRCGRCPVSIRTNRKGVKV